MSAETREVLCLIFIPTASFAALWLGVGALLWFKPHLWDIAGDAAKSPPLVEEEMQ